MTGHFAKGFNVGENDSSPLPEVTESRAPAFTILYKQNMINRDQLDIINELLTPEPLSPRSRASHLSYSQLSQFKQIPLRPSLSSKYSDGLTDGLSVYKAAKHISIKMDRLAAGSTPATDEAPLTHGVVIEEEIKHLDDEDMEDERIDELLD